MGNNGEKSLAIQHINKLLKDPIFNPEGGEEGLEGGGEKEEPSEEEPTEEPEA